MLKISESYIIGFDLSEPSQKQKGSPRFKEFPFETALTISKYTGSKLIIVNQFSGEEAVWMYERLTNKKLDEFKHDDPLPRLKENLNIDRALSNDCYKREYLGKFMMEGEQ